MVTEFPYLGQLLSVFLTFAKDSPDFLARDFDSVLGVEGGPIIFELLHAVSQGVIGLFLRLPKNCRLSSFDWFCHLNRTIDTFWEKLGLA